jgi:hypothetical protein
MTGHDFPGHAHAYREYALMLPDGSKMTIAVTLGDLEADTIPARFARAHDGVAHGLVSVLDMPGAPELPIVWVVNASELILASAPGDREMSADLDALIGEHLGLFFVQTAPYAPELAGIELEPLAVANDNHTVH